MRITRKSTHFSEHDTKTLIASGVLAHFITCYDLSGGINIFARSLLVPSTYDKYLFFRRKLPKNYTFQTFLRNIGYTQTNFRNVLQWLSNLKYERISANIFQASQIYHISSRSMFETAKCCGNTWSNIIIALKNTSTPHFHLILVTHSIRQNEVSSMAFVRRGGGGGWREEIVGYWDYESRWEQG